MLIFRWLMSGVALKHCPTSQEIFATDSTQNIFIGHKMIPNNWSHVSGHAQTGEVSVRPFMALVGVLVWEHLICLSEPNYSIINLHKLGWSFITCVVTQAGKVCSKLFTEQVVFPWKKVALDMLTLIQFQCKTGSQWDLDRSFYIGAVFKNIRLMVWCHNACK